MMLVFTGLCMTSLPSQNQISQPKPTSPRLEQFTTSIPGLNLQPDSCCLHDEAQTSHPNSPYHLLWSMSISCNSAFWGLATDNSEVTSRWQRCPSYVL